MIDCHTHLSLSDFDADRDSVLEQARGAGVTHVAMVGQDLAENRHVLEVAGERTDLLVFLGLHPDRFADRGEAIPPEEVDGIEALIRQSRAALTGIGEVGLDYWVCRDEARKSAQREAFVRMIRLARELDLPLNVHSRSAGHYVIDLLIDEGAERVLLHAFDGRASHALRGVEAGFLFSVPPSIVRSDQKKKLVRALPLEALTLETDSPVLGPEKGARNVPANVVISLKAIAEIKNISEPEAQAVTTENARRLFRL